MRELTQRGTGKALHVSDESVEFWLERGYRLAESEAKSEPKKAAAPRRSTKK